MEQERNEVIVEKLDDRRTAGADGIAVTSPHNSVGVGYAHHRRFLALEALNGVGALHLGRQIDLQDLNGDDFRHRNFLLKEPFAPERLELSFRFLLARSSQCHQKPIAPCAAAG